MTIRWTKLLLLSAVALYYALVVIDNLTDFNSNYQFVRHVLLMDSTFAGNQEMGRAIHSQTVHLISYSPIWTSRLEHPSRLVPMNEVAAVIIAAGASSRLGEPKQLLLLEGETLLGRAIRVAKEAGTRPVLLVLGAHRERIEAKVDLSRVKVVANDGWQEGMASSIRLGVEELSKQAPGAVGVLLMICDQPAVTSEHLERMIEAFSGHPASAVASTYAGKRGIPAIFPRSAFVDLVALTGDQGARGLLSQVDREVIEVPLPGGELDIDRPADLIHLRSGKPMQYLG